MSTLSNPVNWVLAAVLGYISYNYFSGSGTKTPPAAPRPRPPALVFKEYTPKELAEFDGRTEDTRILMAVQGKVFDVTRGRNFYGPDGPYGNFAGRDASRGLAKNSFDKAMLSPLDGPIDKLEDLDDDDKESLANWAEHFEGKYQLVGKLIENKA
ncbi:membrane-associated progesterone receptor component [Entomortierella parvispora]|uniref:Membrane-associated progesterone receptor component n=1 Tax=Entomortierella parvispora TaxID=205924 RepID=A0A9P3M1N0_9FUNG|nr:membrane-associated progesterone receptor component [Entomortierella parvispora]